MSEALLVSNVLLWVAVVLLAGVVFALVRQIGVLHERLAPAGALSLQQGPGVGEPSPAEVTRDLSGREHVTGGATADGRSVMLFFLSPSCPVCKTLFPALLSMARCESAWLRVVLVGDGPAEAHAALVRAEGLEGLDYRLSPSLGIRYQISKLPYAVLVDGAGVIRSKGLVNTREHLESLIEAKERGVASIQEYFERAPGAARPVQP